jgi:hypothetical protein
LSKMANTMKTGASQIESMMKSLLAKIAPQDIEAVLREIRGEVSVVPTGKRGRPKGSKNKAKTGLVEAIASQEDASVTVTRKRGRPAGSTNKAKVETVQTVTPAKRGRPKGSTNKAKVEPVQAVSTVKRGRPKGSLNKPKVEAVVQTVVAPIVHRGRPKGSTNKPKVDASTSTPGKGYPGYDEFMAMKAKGEETLAQVTTRKRGRPKKIAA